MHSGGYIFTSPEAGSSVLLGALATIFPPLPPPHCPLTAPTEKGNSAPRATAPLPPARAQQEGRPRVRRPANGGRPAPSPAPGRGGLAALLP